MTISQVFVDNKILHHKQCIKVISIIIKIIIKSRTWKGPGGRGYFTPPHARILLFSPFSFAFERILPVCCMSTVEEWLRPSSRLMVIYRFDLREGFYILFGDISLKKTPVIPIIKKCVPWTFYGNINHKASLSQEATSNIFCSWWLRW